jgi:hypothetical protein
VEPKPALLSPAEYLEREEKNPVKCEYVDGEVYAMSDDVVESSCLGLRLDLPRIYEGVELPPPGVAEPEPPEYAAAG